MPAEPAAVAEVVASEVVPVAEPRSKPKPIEAPETNTQLLRRATENVSFFTASAVLTDTSKGVLNDLAALLKAQPRTRLRIVGHTDSEGEADRNARLSYARAEACRTYLLDKGIEVGRIDTAGFGERKPIASNNTPEGKQRNRRVEFELL